MTRLYAIFSKPEDGPEAIAAVRQGFSWGAFVLTPLWALANRAWMLALVWFVVVFALLRLVPVLGLEPALWLYGVFALWCGFAAPQIREAVYARGGWIAHGELSAASTAGAESVWLTILYRGRL